ncbi:hypothetical protein [Novosphingobium sp. Chol11]|uniref:hypothetical protein n=1 Tax=Novosphingobium sp. Chol11 TaxID=1385763 RepID=UPI0025F6C2E4|nr:hypothetical protein [Novosphingobium sp. Chol11]
MQLNQTVAFAADSVNFDGQRGIFVSWFGAANPQSGSRSFETQGKSQSFVSTNGGSVS